MSTATAIAEAPPIGTKTIAESPKTGAEQGIKSFSDMLDSKLKGVELPKEKTETSKETQRDEPKKSLLEQALDQHKEKTEPEFRPKSADWKQVNEERATLKGEVETLRKQLEETKGKAVDPTKLTELETQLNETKRELELRAFERSERFKKEYQAPYESKVTEAKALAEAFELDPAFVDRALSMNLKDQLSYIEENISSTVVQAKMAKFLDDAGDVRKRREEALNLNREQLAKMSAEERAAASQSEQKQSQEILAAFEAFRPKIADKIPHFRKKEGDEAWNNQVEENYDLAKKIITGEADQEDVIAAPYLAVAARSAFKQVDKLQKENKALLERLAEYTGNEARVSSGEGTPRTSDGKPRGMLDIIKGKAF